MAAPPSMPRWPRTSVAAFLILILTLACGRGETTAPGTRLLRVLISGAGSGTVTSSPAGIDCGATCSFDFAEGTVVTLTASVDAGSTFVGWSGGCTGAAVDCQVTVDAAKSVTATFDVVAPPSYTLTVTGAGSGSGTVTSSPAGIDCGATCSFDFTEGTVVTLTASVDAGSTFVGWSGGCTGAAVDCQVTVDAAKSVTATFQKSPVPVATVVVSPAVDSVAVGARLQLLAVTKDAQGNVLTGRPLTWTTSDDLVATVDADGLVSAADLGDVTVTATSEGQSGTATLTTQAFTNVYAGAAHMCGLVGSGEAYCWGDNSYGQLGDGSTTNRLVPVLVTGGLRFDSLATGIEHHTCGLQASGIGYCWGRNDSGMIGDGTMTNRETPTPISGGLTFRQLAVGNGQTCGLTPGGAAYCWGYNQQGGVGDGTFVDRDVPTAVSGGFTFDELLGSAASCGVTVAGAAYCWGNNLAGAVGDSTMVSRTEPVAVAGALLWSSLTGDAHKCGRALAGDTYCWGYNFSGSLGDGTRSNRSWPEPISGALAFVQLVTGGYHSCGLDAGGTVYCWGSDTFGSLGVGTTTEQSAQTTPAQVLGGVAFTRLLGAGVDFTCALATDGTVYCWGKNGEGELGNDGLGPGVILNAPTPVPWRVE